MRRPEDGRVCNAVGGPFTLYSGSSYAPLHGPRSNDRTDNGPNDDQDDSMPHDVARISKRVTSLLYTRSGRVNDFIRSMWKYCSSQHFPVLSVWKYLYYMIMIFELYNYTPPVG